jgi:phosphoserine phosphatase
MFKDKDGNYKLKIAFDYDGTLTDPLLFLLAQRFIAKGHDVWIITARISFDEACERFGITAVTNNERNYDILETAQELGIEDKIIYTNLEEKKGMFMVHQFDLLFDDDAKWHCNSICEAGGIAAAI